jgi:CheY-like chemotaxis protein
VQNLIKIFQHGFTTKPGGHGFGLHSSANAARELGGSLTVRSPGELGGATFVVRAAARARRKRRRCRMTTERNVRILVVDDNPSIHDDFKKVLSSGGGASRALVDIESALFGDAPAGADANNTGEAPHYEITCARQGEEALALVRAAVQAGKPYAVAFLDVRMPPGWDGVETLGRLWQVDPELQAVICTAFSDYTWGETVARLGQSDRLLVLKKPFDAIEVCQMASALVEKWNLTQSEREHLKDAQAAECEARAYAASLETVNHALETALATAEESSRARADFLLHITRELLSPMSGLLERAADLHPSAHAPRRKRRRSSRCGARRER